jgi:hypothetical protein
MRKTIPSDLVNDRSSFDYSNRSFHLNAEKLFGWNIEIMTAEGSGHTAPHED